ncbi:ATP-binding protein [Catenisphaera adipataccumulans]|jgi:predicted AAA+ superfamily ATPase|uniref:ATP-binding protein n=1 Tax=Catenisphaera adipataccumulans TaxID=700500 RepID=A0A7W8FW79_9FIRM|nr:ATP-binding protein [Catenisphaera adipataccumulans]MBB5182951.1 hypothetical protein [Catenisphaera adipataccumulans]
MYRLISQFIVYRDLDEDSILYQLGEITRRFDSGNYQREALISDIYEQVHRLLDVATTYGFNTNLWHNYLAYLLATTETPFTLVSEKVGPIQGSVNEFAKHDFKIFKALFDYNFHPLENELGIHCFSTISNYRSVGKKDQIYNKSVSEKVQELSAQIEKTQNEDELYDVITRFYQAYGVGKFGLNKAFRVGEKGEKELLIPITNTSEVRLDDLVGYEIQKQQLIDNTEAFVHGRRANNVLLYGDAGTGKSTSIKAILNQYYDQGLRLIEIYKHQFKELTRIIATIKNRNYRFILYMDDLSFEEFETEYKYLKAVIEGGLEPKPENMLIYATSNRRNLIRETWSDRSDMSTDGLHRSDTIQEKLSLVDRFGVRIGYFKPSTKEFYHIVDTLMARYPEVQISQEELHAKANQWELRHGGLSGRTAQQFIDYIVGQYQAK